MGQQVIVNSGGTPTNAPNGANVINQNDTELYQGADVVGLTVAGATNPGDLVDVLQAQAGVVFTASVGGASAGTLTGAITAGTYAFLFADGEIRVVTVASGGTACTWGQALSAGSITTATPYLRKSSSQSAGFPAPSTVAGNLGAIPKWVHVGSAIGFAAFAAAAFTNSIALFNLPAGGVIHGIKTKHSTSFGGGGITAYTISVGIAANLAKYASAFDCFQAVSNTAFELSDDFVMENDGAVTAVEVTATSTGAELNAATAGAVDIFALLSIAK